MDWRRQQRDTFLQTVSSTLTANQTVQTSSDTRVQRGGWVLRAGSICAVVGLALVLIVPWTPIARTPGDLDYSWQQVMHLAWVRGLDVGTDVVFTMGPWGFTYRSFHPATYSAVLGVWMLHAVALALGLMQFARSLRRAPDDRSTPTPRLGIVPVALWAAALVVVCDTRFPLVYTFPALLLLAWTWARRSGEGQTRTERAVMALLVVSMAMGALTKFTFFASSTIAIFMVCADDVLRHRRFPWNGVVYTGALAIFWTLAGQSFSGFFIYLRGALDISDGYSGAMSLDPPNAVWDVLAFGVPMTVVLTLVGLFALRRDGWRGLILPVGLAGVMFIVFKSAFVRHTTHFTMATVALLPLAGLFLPVLWRDAGLFGKRIGVGVRVGCLCILLGCVSVVVLTFDQYRAPSYGKQVINSLASVPTDLFYIVNLRATYRTLVTEHEAKMADIRAASPLPALEGRVDVYPFRQSVVVANDLPYAPRPVFQSYAAFTSKLASRNERHLHTSRAADTILFDVATIDRRYPSLDDGISWLSLWNLYDVQTMTPDFLVLRRATAPKNWTLQPMQHGVGKLGEPIAVPDTDRPLWVTIDLKPTTVGAALGTLYKPPTVWMTVDLPGDDPPPYRLLTDVARGGFLLSPLVDDKEGWWSIARGTQATDLVNRRIRSIMIDAGDHGSTFYEAQFAVQWFTLETQ